MYKQVAIDPDGIAKSWERFKYYFDQLGTDHGRLLFKFPSKWPSKVLRSKFFNALSPINQTRVSEKLRSDYFNKQKLSCTQKELNPTADTWIENTLMIHREHGVLDLIVTEEETNEHAIIISFDDVDSETMGWRVDRPWRVRRGANELAASAEQLLLKSRRTKFVDQHFHFDKPRYVNTLKSFIKILEGNPCIESVEYHLGLNSAYFDNSLDNFKTLEFNLRDDYMPKAEESILFNKLKFIFWHNDRETLHPGKRLLHARYLLTDVGGLNYEHGLDEDTQIDSYTDVTLVDNQMISQDWDKYQESNSTFQYLGSYSISENI
ncbi:hypothetical protein OAL72_00975 [bacterium]|nr:hypothetical protein [bacterium]